MSKHNKWAAMTPEQRELSIQELTRKQRERWLERVGRGGLFSDVPIYKWLAHKLSLPEEDR